MKKNTKGVGEVMRSGATKPLHDLQPKSSVKVWVDIDNGIADEVKWLNRFKGVRTFASCEGTIGEGGANPHKAYVMAYIPEIHLPDILKKFEIGEKGDGWVYLHPINAGVNWYDLAQQRKVAKQN